MYNIARNLVQPGNCLITSRDVYLILDFLDQIYVVFDGYLLVVCVFSATGWVKLGYI